ncbi:minor capsid protein [Bacteroides clarus]|uniref:minor capsid protein n=1 Tax=Bacteroides clarus TaxID=626929 RepID=UPI00248E9C2B|nr:minor capsid protein [Bacteroides clarus]
MASKTFHFPGFSLVQGDIKVDVKLNRFEKQFQEAQYYLDSQIMNDMVPYMPHRDGNFVNVTRLQSAALAGSGKVVAGAPPQGRFLYEGKVMVDPVTGSPWARKGAKKVVTERPLTYSNPKATPHWFDTAKEKHGKSWVKGVKRIAGGGKQ